MSSARRNAAARDPWRAPTGRLAALLAAALAFSALWERAAVAQEGWFAGITEPVFDVELSLAVPGIMTAQRFKEGDFVHTNDAILQLDNRLEELEAERHRLVMENRKADWESTKIVSEKSASVSRDELLKKQADYRVAAVEYQMAVEALRRRQLLAPGDGVIAELNLHLGESCAAYQPIVRVVDTRRCYFTSNIDARLLNHVKAGQPMEIEIDDGKTPIRVRGKVVFVSPVVDSASGLQKVKGVFDNTDDRVRPGLAGRARVESSKP